MISFFALTIRGNAVAEELCRLLELLLKSLQICDSLIERTTGGGRSAAGPNAHATEHLEPLFLNNVELCTNRGRNLLRRGSRRKSVACPRPVLATQGR